MGFSYHCADFLGVGARPASPGNCKAASVDCAGTGCRVHLCCCPSLLWRPEWGSGPLFSSLSGCEDLCSCDRVEVGSVLSYSSHFLEREGELNVSGATVAAQCGASVLFF